MKELIVALLIGALVQKSLSTTKIINGELASEGQFPHMVQLSIKRSEATKYCGGSLLDSQWILTAAHCVHEMESAKAYLGSVFMRTMKLKLNVIESSIHPLYKNVNAHDIALVKLEKPVKFSDRIQPISLPSTKEDLVNATLLVPGFGETKNASQSNIFLRYVRMQAITNDECGSEWGWNFRGTLICANGLNQTTCNGDSGNGLVLRNKGESVVLGIVSFGAPGCVGKPKVFTRVSSYLDYIHSVTGIQSKTE